MPKIIEVKSTDKLLKIYFLKLYEIGFLNRSNLKEERFSALISSKSLNEINSKELFDCCSVQFADFKPDYFYYLGEDNSLNSEIVFDIPILYTSIEKLGNIPLYEAKYGHFPETGCDIVNINGEILKSIHPSSLYIGDERIIGKYSLEVDSETPLFLIDEYSFSNQYRREFYFYENNSIVHMDEWLDKKLIIDAIKKHGISLEYASEEFRNKKEVVLAIVMKDGSSLSYASENLKNDKDIVLAAVENFWPALKFASKELQLDKDVQNCVTQYLEEIVSELNYREHLDGKMDDGFFDNYEQEYNKLSREINKLLRSKNCTHLKDDQDFMIKILTVLYRCNSEFSIVFHLASEKLLQSKEFLLDLLNEPGVFYYEGINEEWNKFPSSFWLDGACVLAILNHSVDSFNYASEELKSNRDFVLEAVNIKGSALKYVSKELKSDKEIVISAIKNNSSAFQFASPLLQGDKEIIDLKEKDESEDELPF